MYETPSVNCSAMKPTLIHIPTSPEGLGPLANWSKYHWFTLRLLLEMERLSGHNLHLCSTKIEELIEVQKF